MYGAEEDIWAQEGRGNRVIKRQRNEELHNLYPLLNIFQVLKSRRMRWAVHEVHKGQ